jgi:hypothetical protein
MEADLRSDEPVGGQPIRATDNPEPARLASGPRSRPTGTIPRRSWHRSRRVRRRCLQAAPPPHRGDAVGDRNNAHRAEIDQDPARRRATGKTVPTAAHDRLRADSPHESERLRDICRRRTDDHDLGPYVRELRQLTQAGAPTRPSWHGSPLRAWIVQMERYASALRAWTSCTPSSLIIELDHR